MRGLLPLLDLFDDLEQQAAGLELERRDAEVEDRVRDEYAEVDLAVAPARLGGVRGGRSGCSGSDEVRGTLVRVGVDWCLLEVDGPVARRRCWCVRARWSRRGASPTGRCRPAPAPS